jgi:hypothetical protein
LQKFIPLLFLLLCGGIPPPFLYSDSVCDIVASVRDIVPSPSLGLIDFAVLRGCCFWVEVSVVVAACGD